MKSKKELGKRKGSLSGMEVQEKGLDKNGNPRYHTDDPSCTLGKKCKKGGRDFSSYEKFSPVEEGKNVIKITESDIVHMVNESINRILKEEAEGLDEKSELVMKLKDIFRRADFYYPMSDDYRGTARNDYYQSFSDYRDTLSSPIFSDEEANAYLELWDLKEKLSEAEMSGKESEEEILKPQYDEMFEELFS